MSLRDFGYLLQKEINNLSEKELEEYISMLKLRNYRNKEFVSSAVLTSNTYPIIQSIEFNNIIIKMCEERLMNLKGE